jgi:hypothetical protein
VFERDMAQAGKVLEIGINSVGTATQQQIMREITTNAATRNITILFRIIR